MRSKYIISFLSSVFLLSAMASPSWGFKYGTLQIHPTGAHSIHWQDIDPVQDTPFIVKLGNGQYYANHQPVTEEEAEWHLLEAHFKNLESAMPTSAATASALGKYDYKNMQSSQNRGAAPSVNTSKKRSQQASSSSSPASQTRARSRREPIYDNLYTNYHAFDSGTGNIVPHYGHPSGMRAYISHTSSVNPDNKKENIHIYQVFDANGKLLNTFKDSVSGGKGYQDVRARLKEEIQKTGAPPIYKNVTLSNLPTSTSISDILTILNNRFTEIYILNPERQLLQTHKKLLRHKFDKPQPYISYTPRYDLSPQPMYGNRSDSHVYQVIDSYGKLVATFEGNDWTKYEAKTEAIDFLRKISPVSQGD